MSARYVLKAGPGNRNSDYAHRVTVIADDWNEAKRKACVFYGYAPRDTSIWLISVEEIDTNEELLGKLAKLLKEIDGQVESDETAA